MQFDPYADLNENSAQTALEQAMMGLRYEDNVKLRASLVLDAYQNQLDLIKVQKLNYSDQEKY